MFLSNIENNPLQTKLIIILKRVPCTGKKELFLSYAIFYSILFTPQEKKKYTIHRSQTKKVLTHYQIWVTQHFTHLKDKSEKKISNFEFKFPSI